jgi:hypothetical protein
MYENAYRILDFLPLRKNSQEEIRYIDYLWGSFQTLGENEKEDIRASGIISFHMLFMLCCQYKVLRIFNSQPNEYWKLFTLVNVRKENRGVINPTSALTLGALPERDIFRICKLVNLHDSIIAKACTLIDDRNEFAHANGKIEIDYEQKIDMYIEILEAVQDKFLDMNNNVGSGWNSQLDPADNKTEFIETNLAQEYLCQSDFENGLLKKEFEAYLQ